MEKYITFSTPIKKKCGDSKIITRKLRFIDSFRLMPTSLSELVDNMSGKIFNSIEFKKCMERKNIKPECDFIGFKNNRLNYRCKECKRKSTKSIDRLIEKFSRMHQFCNSNLNKFVLLLRKGVYPYEFMDSWEKFDETSLTDEKYFYRELNLEDISDKDYSHAQKVFCTYSGDYHNLYVQCDTLLVADAFENFRNNCLEIYRLDPVYFVSAPGLVWQACLKKTEVKFELITDYDMPLMIEKGTRGEICQATHRYAKTNNKCMNNYDKNIESSYIEYLDANNLYG